MAITEVESTSDEAATLLRSAAGRASQSGASAQRGVSASADPAGSSSAEERATSLAAPFRQNLARFRLYRRRSLQLNTHFAASFKIHQII